MVDWKKEISLSDLVGRKQEPEQPDAEPELDAAEGAYGWLTEELGIYSDAALAEVTAEPQPAPPPVIHPPVPADELPPVEDADEQAPRPPFWKRELSFGRGPREPKEAKEPKEKQEKKPRRPRREKRPKEPEERPERRRVSAPARPSLNRPRGGKRLVGLKVGASQLAAASVANNGSPHLLQVAREPLEPGIVSAGELQDPDALGEALKEFFGRHKLAKRAVRLGIATSRLGVRSFQISGIDDPKQLANAVRFRAQEVLPIPVEEAVLDYRVLRERPAEDGSTERDVLIVVAYRDLVDRYVAACRKAGIRLVGIDLEAFALLRAVGASPDEPAADAATVVVSIGYDRSTFAVSDGSTCEFTRVLEWGGSALDVVVARVVHLTPSAAEPVKRALALSGPAVPEGLSAEQAAAAREAIRAEIGTFARQLVSSLQFYQSQPGSLSISSLRITGGTSHLPGLAEELSRLIGVDVQVADPLAAIRLGKKVREVDQAGSLAVAIGLGIED